jgi:multidrug transporter EmrE-like cation transporter
MNTIFIGMIAVVCNVAAQIAMKYSGKSIQQGSGLTGLLSPWLFIALMMYGVSFFLTIRVYAANSLSMASPLMAGGTFLLIAFSSFFLLNESMNVQKILGMAIILLGIFVLSKS